MVELGRQLITSTLKKLDWPTELITELIVGVGMIEGGLMVPARQIAFDAGLPESLPTLTVDRACCSGATTIGLAARSIGQGATSVLCLGIESMSRTPGSSVSWYSRLTCRRPCDSAATLKQKSAGRLPLAIV